MKKALLIFSFLTLNLIYAQVGIGNTNPKAQLDISASSLVAPIATDGLLIPRVTAFPASVTANQNGMLVFLTTAFSTNKIGFYYYDFPSLSWKWLAAGNNLSPWVNNNSNARIDVPFQSDGVTPRPAGNEAVILDNGNVGFGTLTPPRNFTVSRNINTGTKFAVENVNTGNQAFSQITAEAKGNTAYLYSINDTYPLVPAYPWFTPANTLLQSTGVGGLSLGATETNAFINFFTGGRDESMRISAAGNVGVGTKNPVSPIHISGTSASILLERFGNGSHFVGRSANGTQASPTPLLANEIATRLSGWGYNGSGYWPTGIIDIMAEENQTATNAGGFIKFTTTNIGGTASSEKMRISANGNVGIGTTNPTKSLVLNQKNATDGFQFTGQSIAGPGTGTGFITTLGYNIVNNKQMWLGDPDYLGLSTGGFTRFGVYNGIPALDGVRGDGALRTKLTLGVAGDINSGVILSNTYTNGGFGVGSTAGTAALNGTLPSGSLSVDGQIGVGIAIPNTSAIIDLTSTTKGLLLPRMTRAQRIAIVSPVAGLSIYQTDNTPGLRVYNGTNWMKYSETID